MLKNNILLIFIIFLFSSCFFRKNNRYADDLRLLNKKQFAEKYYTLYDESSVDFLSIKKDQAYYILRNGTTFQYLVFSDDNFVYATPRIPLSYLDKNLSPIKLFRYCYFKILNNTLKTEYIAATPGNVYPIIEEGNIKGDTIFMFKSYNAKGFKNKQKLFDNYILDPKIKVYKIGDDYFLENKKL